MGIALHEFHSTRRTAFELQKLNVDFAHAGFPSFVIGFHLREPGVRLRGVRKRIIIGLLAFLVIGVVVFFVSQPKKGSVEWHKRAYLDV